MTTQRTQTTDCAIILVAYKSDADLPALLDSVAPAAGSLECSIVVVDNNAPSSGQPDALRELCAGRPNVKVIDAGGNLGYSGGLNVGLAHVPQAEVVLFLNPDLVLQPGCIETLLSGCRISGAAVPQVIDGVGHRQTSLRREPTLSRALGEALFGSRWASRPGWLSETVKEDASYRREHDVDWATGAALMVQTTLLARIGPWDSARFFLYSEETDYCRRIREVGASVTYCPNAIVSHTGGGSGSSASLDALLHVNKVRYFRKWHSRPIAPGSLIGAGVARSLFFAIAVLHAALRPHNPGARLALRALLSRRVRGTLPGSAR
jgi:GT2 family glycosyltransferase